MRKSKVSILEHQFIGYNDSGEELYDWVDNGRYVIGHVGYQGSTDSYSESRNSSEVVVKIFSNKIIPWISRKDRFEYAGNIFVINQVPEVWKNDTGYRDAFIITGVYVEG